VRPQRLYLVGAGVIARYHASAATHLPRDVTVAAADPDRDARAAFADEFPDAALFDDATAMLDAPSREDDIVVVAAPPVTHRDLAVSALESGRHVLCEKPLAMDTTEARAMLSAAREADRLLGSCACRFAEAPSTEAVRERLDAGALGDVYRATWVDRRPRSRSGVEYQPESRWFLDASVSGGGVLMDWGPYDFHTVHDLLEPVAATVSGAWTARPATAVDPTDVPNDVEQHVGATVSYDLGDGRSIAVTYERAACTHGRAQRAFELEGTDGAVTFDWIDETDSLTVGGDEGGEVVSETVEPDREPPVGADGPLGVHDRPLVFFDRAIRGADSPVATGTDALFDFAVLRAVYDCAEVGEPVTVDRDTVADGVSSDRTGDGGRSP
jgi:predicted dehydrogenase